MKHTLGFKSAVIAGAAVLLASISVPVSVSASVTTQQQKIQTQRVSQKRVRQFNERISQLSPTTVNHQLTTMQGTQLHRQAVKATTQLKHSLTDPQVANQLKSVTLKDLQAAATPTNIKQGKRIWSHQATNKLQKQLKHTAATELTPTQAQQVENTSVSQAVAQLTPIQVQNVLKGLTEEQWQTLLQQTSSAADTQIRSLKTPTNAQLKTQSQKLTPNQVTTVKNGMTSAANQTSQKQYYTDALNNGEQLTLRSNLASSLVGLLLPAISIAVKLGVGPTVGLIAGKTFKTLCMGAEIVAITILDTIIPKIFSIFFPVLLAAIPLIGPALSAIFLPLNLTISGAFAIGIPILGGGIALIGSQFVGLMAGAFYGAIATLASLLLPILPPVLTPPLVTVGQRFDQTITYADSLKNGHQYTQAINVQAGKSYKVSFKADQAVNPETNDPITNFGTLTYGLVGTPTEAIANSSVSDLVANVQNGSATISSRAKTNYVITFDAQKTGTLYLVADTAQATINTGIQHSQYSTTPLWYVNSAIDATLN